MSELVSPSKIEALVGATRSPTEHIGRAVSANKTVYVMHSQQCLDSGIDFRQCEYSRALDEGISDEDWADFYDTAVVLGIIPNNQGSGWLIPKSILW